MAMEGLSTELWREGERQRSPRVDYIRKTCWSKAPVGGDLQPECKMSVQKVYWYTKSFRETEGQPWVIRRAKALDTLLNNIPIFIRDQQVVVGYAGERPNYELIHHEVNDMIMWDYYYDAGNYIDENDKEFFKDAIENYWSKICFSKTCERYITSGEKANMMLFLNIVLPDYGEGNNSTSPEYDWVYHYGLGGILELIDKYESEFLLKIRTGPSFAGWPDPVPTVDQWDAMRIAVKGFSNYIQRHARLTKIVAENFETDAQRNAELLKISEVCAKVAVEPIQSFHEALQFHLFTYIGLREMERVGAGHSFRMDQLWWPYYKKDVLDEKTLTKAEAVDLLAEWQIRHHENAHVVARMGRTFAEGGHPSWPTITLGGVTEEGKDACNDLTDAVLESIRHARVSEPSYVFRYHPNARIQTIRQAFESVKQGLGYPSFQNDTVLTDTLIHNYGATLEEARSWANVVCLSPGITKSALTGGRGGPSWRSVNGIMVTKMMELALYDGYDPVMNMQLGPHTGDANTCKTFEEFLEMWRGQVTYFADMVCRLRNTFRFLTMHYLPVPLNASFFEHCIRLGLDSAATWEDEVPDNWCTLFASNEIGDCLYPIKKLVFEDKKYTMEQLIEALKADWEGYEEMRMECVQLPKWGNDVDEADEVQVKAFKLVAEEVGRNREVAGAKFLILPENVGMFQAQGLRVGALPNGRRLGDPMYDAGVSPGAGCDKKGPTAVLNSASKVDWRNMKNALLNQRLSPSQMAGEKGFQLFTNYLKVWHDLGIPQVQFNCVDTDTLRAAQRDPEKYSELIVRVAGYSAHFVDLARRTQDSVVARTLQEL